MELSQVSLAMLALLAFPIGVLMNIAYSLGAPALQTPSVWLRIYANLRDFVFMIIAGILTVILVYYVNDGEYRYLAPLGALGGFLISDLVLRKPITKARDRLLRGVVRILLIPIHFIMRKTISPLCTHFLDTSWNRQTKKRMLFTMQLASNGFENNTEAKE